MSKSDFNKIGSNDPKQAKNRPTPRAAHEQFYKSAAYMIKRLIEACYKCDYKDEYLNLAMVSGFNKEDGKYYFKASYVAGDFLVTKGTDGEVSDCIVKPGSVVAKANDTVLSVVEGMKQVIYDRFVIGVTVVTDPNGSFSLVVQNPDEFLRFIGLCLDDFHMDTMDDVETLQSIMTVPDHKAAASEYREILSDDLYECLGTKDFSAINSKLELQIEFLPNVVYWDRDYADLGLCNGVTCNEDAPFIPCSIDMLKVELERGRGGYIPPGNGLLRLQ